jgi:hypothetical protein
LLDYRNKAYVPGIKRQVGKRNTQKNRMQKLGSTDVDQASDKKNHLFFEVSFYA